MDRKEDLEREKGRKNKIEIVMQREVRKKETC